MTQNFATENILLSDLKPHPRNYKLHPEDQIEHLAASIEEHGLYRNIVIAKDNVVLAGHGVVLAAEKTGRKSIPVMRVDIDSESQQALKILAGDNEILHLGEVDDRALSEILKELSDSGDDALLGTGYDKMMLANLLMVTRPSSEIADFDVAAEWVGMPEYDTNITQPAEIGIRFVDEDDRTRFLKELGLNRDSKGITKFKSGKWSMWWPLKEQTQLKEVKFEKAK